MRWSIEHWSRVTNQDRINRPQCTSWNGAQPSQYPILKHETPGLTFKVFPGYERVGSEKMEKTPEFLERVLEGRARDEKALIRVEVDESLVKKRIVVF